MQTQLGADFDAFTAALGQASPTSIRVNTGKADLPSGLPEVPWTQTGFYLPTRPSFTLTRCFTARLLCAGGQFYVSGAGAHPKRRPGGAAGGAGFVRRSWRKIDPFGFAAFA
nr:hypothetical protein [Rufibacter ruber]